MLAQVRTAGTCIVLLTLFISFIVSGLLLNGIQLCLWLTVKPISRRLYRKINYYLLTCLWNQVLLLIDWSGSAISVYTDTETWSKLGSENALLILNHSNELDWLVAWVLGNQANILGNSKLFIKKAVEWIPIIGWAWKFAEIGFLERNWEKDKPTMDLFVKNLVEYEDPVWLLFFPEGTRFSKEKHDVSMEFAARKGLPHLKHLLIPRTRGFFAITQQLKQNFGAVYSGTLCFNAKLGVYPSLLNVFLGRPVFGEVFLERIPFEDIPTEMDKSAEWLLNNFEKKDKLMDTYEKNGVFPTTLAAEDAKYFNGPIRCHYRPRSILPFLLFCLWSSFCLPFMFHSVKWLLGTGFTSLMAVVFIFAISASFIYKLIDITLISRGSSYGKDVPIKEK
ncbi:1-acyl-sn-glycerol-3-phosphate acyltransferase gamma-like [Daphnia carinata]|uniref:1-acyl-sn-glycerol-3-phosphate acyltransferase gamma-like n=1 Tax=Daphnia carinata TaxID=120202 RepID=UPI00257F4821|nr:1-acyl-sn-glycerol-3-phosphate acyltransferase gamma-like [Daphnia carinata]